MKADLNSVQDIFPFPSVVTLGVLVFLALFLAQFLPGKAKPSPTPVRPPAAAGVIFLLSTQSLVIKWVDGIGL